METAQTLRKKYTLDWGKSKAIIILFLESGGDEWKCGIPFPFFLLLHQLQKSDSFQFHKLPPNVLYIWQIYPKKFPPVLTRKAAERSVDFLSARIIHRNYPQHKTEKEKKKRKTKLCITVITTICQYVWLGKFQTLHIC